MPEDRPTRKEWLEMARASLDECADERKHWDESPGPLARYATCAQFDSLRVAVDCLAAALESENG